MECSERKEEHNPVAQVLAFYPIVNRSSLDSRADSRLFHMRQFNNWCKAIQILELNPNSAGGKVQLRVLDLACGKGGDLGK
jgi:mRNA (guanine-N7-)-methyltransferase